MPSRHSAQTLDVNRISHETIKDTNNVSAYQGSPAYTIGLEQVAPVGLMADDDPPVSSHQLREIRAMFDFFAGPGEFITVDSLRPFLSSIGTQRVMQIRSET